MRYVGEDERGSLRWHPHRLKHNLKSLRSSHYSVNSRLPQLLPSCSPLSLSCCAATQSAKPLHPSIHPASLPVFLSLPFHISHVWFLSIYLARLIYLLATSLSRSPSPSRLIRELVDLMLVMRQACNKALQKKREPLYCKYNGWHSQYVLFRRDKNIEFGNYLTNKQLQAITIILCCLHFITNAQDWTHWCDSNHTKANNDWHDNIQPHKSEHEIWDDKWLSCYYYRCQGRASWY